MVTVLVAAPAAVQHDTLPKPAPVPSQPTITWSIRQLTSTISRGINSTTTISLQEHHNFDGMAAELSTAVNGIGSAISSVNGAGAVKGRNARRDTLNHSSAFTVAEAALFELPIVFGGLTLWAFSNTAVSSQLTSQLSLRRTPLTESTVIVRAKLLLEVEGTSGE